jgi:hypothetical protein
MHAEHSAIHYGAQSQIVEHLAAVAPHVCAAVLARTLVVEAVHLRDLPRLVVAADERDAVRIADFVRQQEEEGLDAVEATVDEVT